MTVPKKAMIFVLTYIMMGITGVIACSQGIFHVVRQSQMEESLKSSAAELRLVAKENRADSAMLICRDDDNTFYQYPIVRNTDDSSRTASDEEYAATLTFYQKSSCTKARKKKYVLRMSMVLDAEDTLPTISDSLGSEFSIRTRKAVDGATLLIVRLTLDREIPEDYTLWVNEQEIILN